MNSIVPALERRAATQDDIPFLMQLRLDTMEAHLVASGEETSEAHHRERMLYRFGLGQVLVENGEPVGLLKLARDPDEWAVIQIQLVPRLQGHGVGRQLLEPFLEEARAARKDVVLNVLKANPAKKLYQRIGFYVEREDEFRFYMRAHPYALRVARQGDVPGIKACIDASYGHYVERIGMLPGPMRDDFGEIVRSRRVTVAELAGKIVGVLVLDATDEGFLLETVGVDPAHWGKGLGRRLLELAEVEARKAGSASLYLYTHERMTENQSLYRKIGYVEFDRRTEHGFARVYMRKPL
jgi:ribosomal protein S18 acetylase RimI-like enzyme